jgi:hypothetical protein
MPQAPSIIEKATNATKLLDEADEKLRNPHDDVAATTADMVKPRDQLNDTRCLLQKIRFQDALQTPAVDSALAKVVDVLSELLQTLNNTHAFSEELRNAMNQLKEATSNLRSQLPGETSIARDNEIEGGFQPNALIDMNGTRPDWRLNTEASGNKAKDAIQTNAPVYGNLEGILKYLPKKT